MKRYSKCKKCNKTFEYEYIGGRIKKYCSAECKAKIKQAETYRLYCENETCGKPFDYVGKPKRGIIKVKYCPDCRKAKGECRNCGKKFKRNRHGNDALMFCSKKCSGIYKRIKNSRPMKVWYNSCSNCGEHIIDRNFRKYCSKKCLVTANNRKKVESRLIDLYINPTYKQCIGCGKKYIQTHKSQNYCSNTCSRKTNRKKGKRKRRKRLKEIKSDTYTPYQIAMRDKKKCKLCGTKTPWSLRGTINDNAPEIDHIVPLSKGGFDTLDNVQLLCRKCNREKSNSLIGQASLFNQPNT